MGRYLGTKEEWEGLRDVLLRETEVGVDTESQEAEEGVGGARDLYVWSIAAFRPSRKLHPRGYYPAVGYCLPREALETFRPLLESTAITKWVHNAPADTRPIYDNAGIILRNARCTLQHARVALPGLLEYGLKPLATLCLGKPKREGYLDVITYQVVTPKVKKVVEKFPCTCGVEGCKKRKGHYRMKIRRFLYSEKTKDWRYDQADLVPGHERWARWVDYAIEDAVDALELASFLQTWRGRMPKNPFGQDVQALARSKLATGQLEWRPPVQNHYVPARTANPPRV